MTERIASPSRRQTFENLLLALLAFVLSVALGIGANWYFYNDYAQQRAYREAQDMKFRATCAELLLKRRQDPNNIYIARDLKKCSVGRSRLEK
jgi:hypothetical protein